MAKINAITQLALRKNSAAIFNINPNDYREMLIAEEIMTDKEVLADAISDNYQAVEEIEQDVLDGISAGYNPFKKQMSVEEIEFEAAIGRKFLALYCDHLANLIDTKSNEKTECDGDTGCMPYANQNHAVHVGQRY